VLVKLLTSAEAQRVDDDLRGLVGGAVPLERVIDPLAAVEAHLATSTHPNAVELVLHAILATAAPPLAEPWVLRGRRSVLAAALDRAALQFPDAMRETPPATVREAAEILSSLDAQDAARDRSLAALAIRLPPDHARKFFARALADIAEPHRPSIFPSPGGTLWQGPKVQAAAALASTLSSDDALGAVHAVAELIARNGKDIDPMLEIGFPSLLSAAVDRAPASGAAQAVEELLRLSPRHELARGVFEALRIAASRVPEADTTAAVGALMRAMRRDTTPEHMNPLARTLAAVPGLSVRDAIDALKYPGCVGPAREALLSAVEARTALKLGTLVEKVSAGEAAAGLRRSDVTDGPRDRPEAR
jgi:hypothetical protein